jgi:cyanate permease
MLESCATAVILGISYAWLDANNRMMIVSSCPSGGTFAFGLHLFASTAQSAFIFHRRSQRFVLEVIRLST